MIDITTFSNYTKITNRQFLVGKPVSECLFFVHFRAFCASKSHEQKPPFYYRVPFIHRGSPHLFCVVKYETSCFFLKTGNFSEKIVRFWCAA